MVWTLYIISTVLGSQEPKVTMYNSYSTKWECTKTALDLGQEFKSNEFAICKKTPVV
jgi:hypothetical protein